MSEERTITSIMEYFQSAVKEKQSLSPTEWVNAAGMINVLIGDEHDKLFDLELLVSQDKAKLIIEDNSVAKAEALSHATQTYKQYRRQKAKIGQIEEFIRIAKVQARLKDTEMSHY